MMTHTQLKQLITEAVLLLVLGIALVIGGYCISSENANKRMQSLYQTRFEPVMKSASYEKVTSKALNGFPEIKGVYIGYNSSGTAEGYVIDLTVKSLYGKDLSMLVALDYESTRITGLALEQNDDENAFYISQNDMKQISDKLIGKQIPIAFVKEEKKDDKKSDKIIVPGLNDGVYYAQRLYDDRNRYIDYVEMEVKNGIISTTVDLSSPTAERGAARRAVSTNRNDYIIQDAGNYFIDDLYDYANKFASYYDMSNVADGDPLNKVVYLPDENNVWGPNSAYGDGMHFVLPKGKTYTISSNTFSNAWDATVIVVRGTLIVPANFGEFKLWGDGSVSTYNSGKGTFTHGQTIVIEKGGKLICNNKKVTLANKSNIINYGEVDGT